MASIGHHLVNLTAAAALCLLLTACGGDDAGVSSTSTESSSDESSSDIVQQDAWVEGYAVKGAIENGLVSLWLREPGAQGDAWVQVTDAIRTRYDGRFRVLVPAEFLQKPLKVVLRSDSQTIMRCDVLPVCRTPAQTTVAFGDWFWPGSNLVLASLFNPEEADSSISLTPLGTLAFHEYIQSGTSDYAGFAAALKQQELRFGLTAGVLLRKPVDLASADLSNIAPTDLKAALLNIAFLSLVGDERWTTLADVLAEAQQRLLVNGKVSTNNTDTLGMSVELVALASLLQANHHQAQVAGEGGKNAALTDTVQSLETLLLTTAKQVTEQAEPEPLPEPLPKPAPEPLPEPSPEIVPPPHVLPLPGVQPKQEAQPPAELNGAATLSWQAPLSRQNGDSLAMGEIGSYEVRYGLSANLENLIASEQVEDGQVMSYTVGGLSRGTWYFAIQTVDTNGLRSEWSDIVSKVVK